MQTYSNSIFKSRRQLKFISFSKKYFLQEINYLITRLFLQTIRRPSSLISGIIQPLLWLILFGSLFQNAPVSLFNIDYKYGPFLSSGIIIFTSFTGSLNSGLPLVFDREFGFLNRLLVAPLISKNTIILSFSFFITCLTMIQTIIIMFCSLQFFNYHLTYYKLITIATITLLITSSISNISLGLAFILPGHIEFLAFILLINMPMLFGSTALAPLYFMPYWLQVISILNPLTYAIESIRIITLTTNKYFYFDIIHTLPNQPHLFHIILLLLIMTILSFISIQKTICKKLE